MKIINNYENINISHHNDLEIWTVPHKTNTNYLTHGYYRYIGKFPPQIASVIIDEFYPGKGIILDPMVGGGTVLIEAVRRGIKCEGWDINPVSLLISRCVTRYVDTNHYKEVGEKIINGLKILNSKQDLFTQDLDKLWQKKGLNLNLCEEYFDEKTQDEIEHALYIINSFSKEKNVSELLLLNLLSCLRRVSFANVKKMNLELDLKKKTKSSLYEEFSRKFNRTLQQNEELPSYFKRNLAHIYESNVMKWDSQRKYGMIIIHPPYLTNTAFSESTQLQLAIMGIDHKKIWKKELRCRGSFLHEPDGLKKYLINWAKILEEATNALMNGGKLAVVIGDGQINYVRIPMGPITIEFAQDSGLQILKKAFHVLNNNTGRTQNKKMQGQHVIIFEKP